MGTFYVDSTVGGPGSGTIGDPWDDLASNVNTQGNGPHTFYLRGGVVAQVYNEAQIDITVDDITVQPYQAELVEIRTGAGDTIFEITGSGTIIDGKVVAQLFLNKNNVSGRVVDINAGADNCEIKNLEIANTTATTTMVRTKANDTLVSGCEIHDGFYTNINDAVGVGIWDGDDNIVEDCTIWDIAGDCVTVQDVSEGTPQGTIIRGNILYTTLDECSMAAIDLKGNYGTQAQVLRNVMYGFRANDSSCGGSGDPSGQALDLHNDADDVLVDGNEIYDCTSGIVMDDGIRNITIQRNIIYDLADAAEDPIAGNLDALLIRATNVDIFNNTFDDCPEDLFHFIAPVSNVAITNNIFNDCNNIAGEGLGAHTASYNCWFGCAETLVGVGDVTDDPDFVNEAANDFHLNGTSPCIDAGIDVGLPYLVTAPDMGAYEYGEGPGDPPGGAGDVAVYVYWRDTYRSQD